MRALFGEVERELSGDILPFWLERVADGSGHWFGRIDGRGKPVPDSPLGCIMYGRILWTFSSAYRLTGDAACLEAATRAREYVISHFMDPEFGGTYWSLTPSGEPLDTKKQFYAIAFVMYGLAEYARATGTDPSDAVSLFRCIEAHSLDPLRGGYIEACRRDWSPIEDMRLSEKDRNDAKTMNTHLHILESYTALCRVWDSGEMRAALRSVVDIFLERILRPDFHLGVFFDEDWRLTSRVASYGHDIEASWLLCEAASVLGDEGLKSRVEALSTRIVEAAMEGWSDGMAYEYDPDSGVLDPDRHWWVQAESVVGFFNQYRLTGSEVWLERAEKAWGFIKDHLLCPDGEWYWSVRPAGGGGFEPNLDDDRAGFWKCPYHNGRMCMELMEASRR